LLILSTEHLSMLKVECTWVCTVILWLFPVGKSHFDVEVIFTLCTSELLLTADEMHKRMPKDGKTAAHYTEALVTAML